MMKKIFWCVVIGLVCMGCASALDRFLDDASVRVQGAWQTAWVNADLLTDASPHLCPLTRFDYNGRAFALVFQGSIRDDVRVFFQRLIEARGGKVVAPRPGIANAYIFLLVRNQRVDARLRIELADPRGVLRLAANDKIFYLEKPWEQFSEDQKIRAMNSIAPGLINSACRLY